MVYRREILTYKDSPRAERLNVGQACGLTLKQHRFNVPLEYTGSMRFRPDDDSLLGQRQRLAQLLINNHGSMSPGRYL